jgi:hypothetical protein
MEEEMIIDYVSDLHIDECSMGGPFGWMGNYDFSKRKSNNATTLVVAGDTSECMDDTIDFYNAATQHYEHIIGIFGNHEKPPLRKSLLPNVHLLENLPLNTKKIDNIVFIGSNANRDNVANSINFHQNENVDHIVAVVHEVPLVDLKLLGIESNNKCNNLLALLVEPIKPTTIIFGHLHLEVDIFHAGFHLLSNPRGYRGMRRDKTAFHAFKTLKL